ncbi:MAG: hypothetical protein Q7V15_05675 [Phenylobacterium sp.]|uniref:DUF6607 family protein n=1 Tax=Phenylobacterium sp. TaxID=1871053 RepID=UPI0027261A07|nr:DUF6607 family protein [Phenylobacterium sp.]MDO8900828.1 hypothetical protein [Phenylobacterium sp.]
MMPSISRRGAMFGTLGMAAIPLAAKAQTTAPLDAGAALDQGRRAVLAMVGDFHVRFDTRETVPFVADYEPADPAIHAGDEVVRVIEDTGKVIRLQHILVVRQGERTFTVRHWRQDWTFEPEAVSTYVGADTWRLAPTTPDQGRGLWSQTVWNTDDSPRYGALGTWAHDRGVSRWTSQPTLRPLARRDTAANPPYDRYACVNRHALTPRGWVHEQDNAKIGTRDGQTVTFVHEAVINTYDRADGFDAAPAEAYLAATQAYWNGVQSRWEMVIATGGGLWLREAPQTGSAAGPALMALAEQVQAGEIALAEALARAEGVIAEATRRPG